MDLQIEHPTVARRLPALWRAPRGNRVQIRPLSRDDGDTLDRVFAGLSGRSRYLRFHSPVPRLTSTTRSALLDVDGQDRLALVAEVPGEDGPCPIGVSRLARTGGQGAEFAVVVVDEWQGRGVGRRLLHELGERAADLGYRELYSDVLPENKAMIRLAERVFPSVERRWDDGVVRLHCRIGAAATAAEVSDTDLIAALGW
jgi:RimJ/RimL family protein N-acetyltransferase